MPVKDLQKIIDHDNHEMRANFREFLKQDTFRPKYAITLAEERQLALDRLQMVCSNDFLSVRDFATNPHRIFAAHELMAMIDPATTTKMTVQVSFLQFPLRHFFSSTFSAAPFFDSEQSDTTIFWTESTI